MKIDFGDGVLIDANKQLDELLRVECEDSLYEFFRSAWRIVDSAPFIDAWALEAVAEHLQAVVDGEIRRLLINIPPRFAKSTMTSVALPAFTWAQPVSSPTSGPGVQFLCASYANPLALRDSVKCRRLIESPWYQKFWGSRFALNPDQNTKSRYGNDRGGERLITSVDAGVTGEGGDIIIIDDPNAANEAFSDATIKATIDWWEGTMSTRLNNIRTGAYIVIQQRLAENDLSGHILEKESDDWHHLCLPMRFEPERRVYTRLGSDEDGSDITWTDPRVEAGDLLAPARFNDEEVTRLEKRLGPYACNPAEAPILMSDMTMKPIGEVRAGDEVVGFDKRDVPGGRFKLTRSKVLEVHSRVAPVVKMTLDSGEVIRCTPDHRWFTKDRGQSREMYMPATLRSRLARVCPPRLPELTPEGQRDAGWLSGFFDGEGSVSACRRGGYEPSSIISFYQGAGRNLPLCEKLERLLSGFGFEFTYSEDDRKTNKDAPCYGYRNYRIKSDGLRVFQRFLHIVQPTKWRDRIIEGCFRSKFIQQRERVISIEPDGEEVVYALTTETGNYVVWGLASSNSAGQLQQRPEPAGGGIIKREWWLTWEDSVFPPMDFIMASLDTAYTEKEENDPSALTIWGVFSSQPTAQSAKVMSRDGGFAFDERLYIEGAPKLMLMYAWTDRKEFHELVTTAAAICKRFKVDKLLVENKASGISVAQELKRLYGREKWGVELNDPKSQDKVSRLYSVQHIFSEGMVFAPDKQWAEKVITQVGQFPKGKHDDLVDTVSQAVRHMRDLGLLTRAEEHRDDIANSRSYPGDKPAPLYPGM